MLALKGILSLEARVSILLSSITEFIDSAQFYGVKVRVRKGGREGGREGGRKEGRKEVRKEGR